MSSNDQPKPSEEDRVTSVFSLRGLLITISVVCIWGAAANYAFSKSILEERGAALIPLVVFSGFALVIGLLQLPLYFLAGYWLKKTKGK